MNFLEQEIEFRNKLTQLSLDTNNKFTFIAISIVNSFLFELFEDNDYKDNTTIQTVIDKFPIYILDTSRLLWEPVLLESGLTSYKNIGIIIQFMIDNKLLKKGDEDDFSLFEKADSEQPLYSRLKLLQEQSLETIIEEQINDIYRKSANDS